MTFGTLKATYVNTGISIIPIEDLRSTTQLHPVAFSGNYTALLNRPTLGTAAALNIATTLVAEPTEIVLGSDTRLINSREWQAVTIAQSEAEAGTSTERRAFTAQRVRQANDSWWNTSTAKLKLDTVETNATADQSAPEIASLFAADGTATQSLKITLGVTSLSSAAFTGSYTDLLNKPALGTAAALDASELRDRVTHTGSQAITTVTGLQDALNTKQATGSYATLDQSGKVPALQLPSYVDDVLESTNFAALPGTGETGKIYTTLNDNRIYRWSGSAYIEISPSPGSTDAVPEGFVNLYYTALRAADAAPVQSVAGRSGNIVLAASDIDGLSTVAISGAYVDLSGKPALLALTTTTAPQPLAANSAIGDATEAARANHVHSRPTLPDLGITTGTQTLTVTVAQDARAESTLTASQVFILHSVTISSAAWIVLYNSSTAAVADTARLQTEDPTPGSGVVTEFVTEGATTIKLSPTATVVSGESPASTSYPVKVKNLGAAASVVVTFNFYKLS